MKVVITGGAGFIGSHTAVQLVNDGYVPIILDDFSNSSVNVIGQIEKIINRDILFYRVDCNNEKEVSSVFSEHPDIVGVIHFAAFKAVGESVEEPEKYYHNNLGSLNAILKVMAKFKVPKLVFSSSCTVYGIPDEIPVGENAPIKEPTNPYGHTKQLGEAILTSNCKFNKDLEVVLLRYFNPIGAHPSGLIGELPKGVPSNLIPFLTQTAAGWRQELTVYGSDYDTPDGTCIRDYIHVMDVAEAHIKAFRWENKSGNIDIFNIGTGRGSSVKDVIDAFETESNLKLPIKWGERREGDVPAIFADTNKAKTVLGWEPKLTISEALLSAWNWQKTLNKPE
ncbi:MAG: UDP-glucose 4-epimerase [Parvicellaceae bacterium]|jgi:UDP-glucose 4-epimerase